MVKTNQNDVVYAGNHRRMRFTLYEPDGVAVSDLTGCTLQWALSRYTPTGDYETEALLRKDTATLGGVEVVGDPTGGVVDVVLLAADTEALGGATYYQELELIDPDGDSVVVATGALTVRKNVSNAAP